MNAAEKSLTAIEDTQIATRIVRLPLSWDDESTQLAIAKYMQSVRADAPWCPSNIEFIRQVNGPASVEDVKRIVFDASTWCWGWAMCIWAHRLRRRSIRGTVWLRPSTIRHALISENAVGIGGAYLCIYGMEGPGGYQFVGRTCRMWNTYKVTAEFTRDKPWLLRFFDQIRFYPVSGAELRGFRGILPRPRSHRHCRRCVPSR